LIYKEKNLDIILNFVNGILIKKDSKKLLFLSFSIEYIRYIHSVYSGYSVFLTHLPILLDATCNLYKLLSMLSNENKWFKKLNLIKYSNSGTPPHAKKKYFYSFMLYRFTGKLSENMVNDIFSMLSCMIVIKDYLNWHLRGMLLKTLMVIPYNAQNRTIKKYIKDYLKYYNYGE